jgi:hypothetical protein
VIHKIRGYFSRSEPYKSFIFIVMLKVAIDALILASIAQQNLLHSLPSGLAESRRDLAASELLLHEVLHISSQPFSLLNVAVKKVSLQILTSHPEHQVQFEVLHGVQKFIAAMKFQNRSQAYFFNKLFVELLVEHCFQNLFTGIFALLKDLPNSCDDLSGSVAATHFFNIFSLHLFDSDYELFHHIVIVRGIGSS